SRWNPPTSTSASPATTAGGSRPTHAAGIVESATRSLSALRSRRISSWTSMRLVQEPCSLARHASLPKLEEELIRRNEERILLQDPADEHHRVRSHDVDGQARAESRQIVRTDHRVLVLRKQVVQPRLVLEQVLDARLVEQRPFHVPQQPRPSVTRCSAGIQQLLDKGQH